MGTSAEVMLFSYLAYDQLQCHSSISGGPMVSVRKKHSLTKRKHYINSSFGVIGISVGQGKMCFLSHSGERA